MKQTRKFEREERKKREIRKRGEVAGQGEREAREKKKRKKKKKKEKDRSSKKKSKKSRKDLGGVIFVDDHGLLPPSTDCASMNLGGQDSKLEIRSSSSKALMAGRT
ncbi:hypothetical protein ACOSP7_017006 [Xanthoceras sorbifolium]